MGNAATPADDDLPTRLSGGVWVGPNLRHRVAGFARRLALWIFLPLTVVGGVTWGGAWLWVDHQIAVIADEATAFVAECERHAPRPATTEQWLAIQLLALTTDVTPRERGAEPVYLLRPRSNFEMRLLITSCERHLAEDRGAAQPLPENVADAEAASIARREILERAIAAARSWGLSCAEDYTWADWRGCVSLIARLGQVRVGDDLDSMSRTLLTMQSAALAIGVLVSDASLPDVACLPAELIDPRAPLAMAALPFAHAVASDLSRDDAAIDVLFGTDYMRALSVRETRTDHPSSHAALLWTTGALGRDSVTHRLSTARILLNIARGLRDPRYCYEVSASIRSFGCCCCSESIVPVWIEEPLDFVSLVQFAPDIAASIQLLNDAVGTARTLSVSGDARQPHAIVRRLGWFSDAPSTYAICGLQDSADPGTLSIWICQCDDLIDASGRPTKCAADLWIVREPAGLATVEVVPDLEWRRSLQLCERARAAVGLPGIRSKSLVLQDEYAALCKARDAEREANEAARALRDCRWTRYGAALPEPPVHSHPATDSTDRLFDLPSRLFDLPPRRLPRNDPPSGKSG